LRLALFLLIASLPAAEPPDDLYPQAAPFRDRSVKEVVLPETSMYPSPSGARAAILERNAEFGAGAKAVITVRAQSGREHYISLSGYDAVELRWKDDLRLFIRTRHGRKTAVESVFHAEKSAWVSRRAIP
jgi:hypothetical protein